MANLPDLDRLLECPICMESYTNPRMLPCIHSFCHACLSDYIHKSTDGQSMLCPVCKTQYSVPQDGASGFIKNFFISNVQEASMSKSSDEKQLSCSITECLNTAIIYCEEGCEYLCKACARVHKSIKASSEHYVVPVKVTSDNNDESNFQTEYSKTVLCEKHVDEQATLYCRDCRSRCCASCLLVDHHNHDICKLSEQTEASREELRHIIKQVEHYMSEVEQHVEATMQHREQAQADIHRVKTQIIDVIDKLHQRLDQRKSELFQKLDKIDIRNTKMMSMIEDGQNLSMTSLKSFACYATSLLHRGSDLDVNEQLVSTLSRKNELEKQSVPTFRWNIDIHQIDLPNIVIGEVDLFEHMDDRLHGGDIVSENRTGPGIVHVALKDRKKQVRGMGMFGGCLWLVQASCEFISVLSSPQAILLQTLTVPGLRDPTALATFNQPRGLTVISDWANGDKYILHWIGIKTNREREDFKITSHRRQKVTYVPRGLSVTSENTLLVGNNYLHSVYMYNMNGQLLHQLQLPRDVWPYTVIKDPLSRGLVMVDGAYITWVTELGVVARRYQPHDKFGPRDIAFDGNDSFYVADYKSKTVECVGSDGSHKGYLLKADSIVRSPTSVCIDRDTGFVYVSHKADLGGYELLRVPLNTKKPSSTSLSTNITYHTLDFTISDPYT